MLFTARCARSVVAGLFLAASIAALEVPVAAAGARFISHQELSRLFPGSFRAFAMGIVQADISAGPDGRLMVKTRHSTENGRWSIRSGKLCISLERTLKGKTTCSRVRLEGGWYRTALVMFKRAAPEIG